MVPGWSRLRRLLLRHLVLAVGHPSFNLRAFFVIIPCGNQQERHGVFGIVILMEDFQGVLKRVAATAIHVAVQAPRCLGVIEAGPYSSDHDFSRAVAKFFIKLLEILLSPIAAIRLPTHAGMHPRVISIKSVRILCWGFIFVDQNRWMLPLINRGSHAVPIRVSALRKN